jgi:multimeric flavodoxin WrbA
MQNILILKGSPRECGNSAVLAGKAAEGARAARAQGKSLYLHGLDIRAVMPVNYAWSRVAV